MYFFLFTARRTGQAETIRGRFLPPCEARRTWYEVLFFSRIEQLYVFENAHFSRFANVVSRSVGLLVTELQVRRAIIARFESLRSDFGAVVEVRFHIQPQLHDDPVYTSKGARFAFHVCIAFAPCSVL